jgi:hypothetical protein
MLRHVTKPTPQQLRPLVPDVDSADGYGAAMRFDQSIEGAQ